MRKSINQKTYNGFTLIELSIVILIIGIILAAIATPYRLYIAEQRRLTTADNIERVSNALANHLKENGRYPCPAPLTATRGDTDYGMETQCDDTVTSGPNAYPAWTTDGQCLDGVCFERSVREVRITRDPSDPEVNPIVRRGTIPFRILQLTEDEVLDGYGNRIQYAVTEHLAAPRRFLSGTGGIEIQNADGESALFEEGSAEFIVFSTGKDSRGAYSREGRLVLPCQDGFVDSENCNTDTSGSNSEAIYALDEYAETQGASHYDDSVVFSATQETPLWRVADDDGLHIRDMIDADDDDRGIGIRTNDPDYTLEIDDDAMVDSDFNVFTNQICDEDGSDCIDVRKFGGDDPNGDLTCGDSGEGRYVTSIGDDTEVRCTDVAAIRCPPGQVVSGFDDDELECRGMEGCETRNVELCYNPETGEDDVFNLPASFTGKVIDTPVSGYSYRERWECNSRGDWRRRDRDGDCNCWEGTETYERSCNSRYSGSWTGTIITEETTICPGDGEDPITEYEQTENCTCVNDTETQNLSCPYGYDGTRKRQRNWTCNADGTDGSYSSWEMIEDNCTCDADRVDRDNMGCPSGFSGERKRERRYNCDTNSWGPWETTVDTCSCVGGTETRTRGCVAPREGNVTERRTYDCDAGSWGPWETIAENCGTVTLRWRSKSPQTGPHSGALSKKRDQICPASQAGDRSPCSSPAEGGHWHYDVCECE